MVAVQEDGLTMKIDLMAIGVLLIAICAALWAIGKIF
jgi:hypothetical protein